MLCHSVILCWLISGCCWWISINPQWLCVAESIQVISAPDTPHAKKYYHIMLLFFGADGKWSIHINYAMIILQLQFNIWTSQQCWEFICVLAFTIIQRKFKKSSLQILSILPTCYIYVRFSAWERTVYIYIYIYSICMRACVRARTCMRACFDFTSYIVHIRTAGGWSVILTKPGMLHLSCSWQEWSWE